MPAFQTENDEGVPDATAQNVPENDLGPLGARMRPLYRLEVLVGYVYGLVTRSIERVNVVCLYWQPAGALGRRSIARGQVREVEEANAEEFRAFA